MPLAVRSPVNYAAVALVSISDTTKITLETIQNTTMRHLLEATHWTKLEALQPETGLPPLERLL